MSAPARSKPRRVIIRFSSLSVNMFETLEYLRVLTDDPTVEVIISPRLASVDVTTVQAMLKAADQWEILSRPNIKFEYVPLSDTYGKVVIEWR